MPAQQITVRWIPDGFHVPSLHALRFGNSSYLDSPVANDAIPGDGVWELNSRGRIGVILVGREREPPVACSGRIRDHEIGCIVVDGVQARTVQCGREADGTVAKSPHGEEDPGGGVRRCVRRTGGNRLRSRHCRAILTGAYTYEWGRFENAHLVSAEKGATPDLSTSLTPMCRKSMEERKSTSITNLSFPAYVLKRYARSLPPVGAAGSATGRSWARCEFGCCAWGVFKRSICPHRHLELVHETSHDGQ